MPRNTHSDTWLACCSQAGEATSTAFSTAATGYTWAIDGSLADWVRTLWQRVLNSIEWQGRKDSNPRPSVLETDALTRLSYAPMPLGHSTQRLPKPR